MPWSQTSPMDQRTQFIADFLRQVLSITELCDLYGVSRKTADRSLPATNKPQQPPERQLSSELSVRLK